MTATLEAPHCPGSTSQLDYRCWTLDLPEPLGDDLTLHHRTEQDAQREAAGHARDHGVPAPGVRQLDQPCHVTMCGCGYAYDADTTTTQHFPNPETARGVTVREGWTADLRCTECRDTTGES
jgi:hypothetical protein